MGDFHLLEILTDAASAVAAELWPAVRRAIEQPTSDPTVAAELDARAERRAMEVLEAAGMGVLSEESGTHAWERARHVVLDPIDGTNNLIRGIPFAGPSLFGVDEHGQRAAVVVNCFTNQTFSAVEGGGAFVDGTPLAPGATSAHGLLIAGPPAPDRGIWSRRFGATAFEIVAVASGRLDGHRGDPSDPVYVWDCFGGALIASEAGCALHRRDTPHDPWAVTADRTCDLVVARDEKVLSALLAG